MHSTPIHRATLEKGSMTFDPMLVLALASGIVVSAACGLRAFLPLLVVGFAGRLGWIPLKDGMHWLETTPALVCFGAATVVEIAGDKIPIVDHMLDTIGTAIRPVAAWIAGIAVLAHWGSPWAQIAGVAFGGSALAVHALKAKARLGSTALTLGHANPLISGAEDLTTLGLLALAILAPLVALAIVVALVVALLRRRRRGGAPVVAA
jgi:uncharacterized membrane protein